MTARIIRPYFLSHLVMQSMNTDQAWHQRKKKTILMVKTKWAELIGNMKSKGKEGTRNSHLYVEFPQPWGMPRSVDEAPLDHVLERQVRYFFLC